MDKAIRLFPPDRPPEPTPPSFCAANCGSVYRSAVVQMYIQQRLLNLSRKREKKRKRERERDRPVPRGLHRELLGRFLIHHARVQRSKQCETWWGYCIVPSPPTHTLRLGFNPISCYAVGYRTWLTVSLILRHY